TTPNPSSLWQSPFRWRLRSDSSFRVCTSAIKARDFDRLSSMFRFMIANKLKFIKLNEISVYDGAVLGRLRAFFKRHGSLFIPPMLGYAVGALWRRFRKGRSLQTIDRAIQFKYGDFLVSCDSSHHLPKILTVLPDFGRNLADVVLGLDVKEPSVIDVGA